MLRHMYPGLETFGQNDVQAPAFRVNAVVYSSVLTTHVSRFLRQESPAEHADEPVWLGEQTNGAARDRTGACRSSCRILCYLAMLAHMGRK